MTRFIRIALHVFFALMLLVGAAWTATATGLHLNGWVKYVAWTLLALVTIGAFAARLRARRLGWAAFGISALAVAGWYQTITPQDDRDWAIDVSRGVKARVEGQTVTLTDIRDFKWHSPIQAEPRWISGKYDLDRLASVDMMTSVWDSPDIAHLLVSFGFTDGKRVVFSVEIRRESNELFNKVGGFFRQFELVLIAATEHDIVKLRTNYRGEDVSLFPVNLTPEQRRTMFMAYVGLAQRLEKQPEFYNTISANCTTVVYGLAKALSSDLPLDQRLIFSGRLPEYLADLGVLGDAPMTPARKLAANISPRALRAGDSPQFSRVIRSN